MNHSVAGQGDGQSISSEANASFALSPSAAEKTAEAVPESASMTERANDNDMTLSQAENEVIYGFQPVMDTPPTIMTQAFEQSAPSQTELAQQYQSDMETLLADDQEFASNLFQKHVDRLQWDGPIPPNGQPRRATPEQFHQIWQNEQDRSKMIGQLAAIDTEQVVSQSNQTQLSQEQGLSRTFQREQQQGGLER